MGSLGPGRPAPLDFDLHAARDGGNRWSASSKTLEWLGVVVSVSGWRQDRPSEESLREMLGIDLEAETEGDADVAAAQPEGPGIALNGNSPHEPLVGGGEAATSAEAAFGDDGGGGSVATQAAEDLINWTDETPLESPSHLQAGLQADGRDTTSAAGSEPLGVSLAMKQVADVNRWLLHSDRLRVGRQPLPDLLREIDAIGEQQPERRICVSMCCSPQLVLDAGMALRRAGIRRRVELEHSGAFVSDIHLGADADSGDASSGWSGLLGNLDFV